jgi:CO dehydrogenase/acetyl-CoA synthase alpha subunit
MLWNNVIMYSEQSLSQFTIVTFSLSFFIASLLYGSAQWPIFENSSENISFNNKKVYAFEDPFSDDARSLIDETLSIRETLQDLFAIRSRKILALTIMHAEGSYYDRDEVKRMIPVEKEMFEQITASIEQCQKSCYTCPSTLHAPHHMVMAEDELPAEAKELDAPLELVLETRKMKKLPVVNLQLGVLLHRLMLL